MSREHEEFNLSRLKRLNVITTFDDDKFLVLNNKKVFDLRKNKVIYINSIIANIKVITNKNSIIARRSHYKKILRRCIYEK